MSQILPVFVTGSTVDEQKKSLLGQLQGTDQSVQACSALDSNTRASWGLWYAQAMTFAQSDSSVWTAASDTNTAQAYATQLYAWQQKLSATCPLTVPMPNPNAPDPTQQAIVQMLYYGAWIAGSVSVAYAIGKVISVIPAPAPRAPRT